MNFFSKTTNFVLEIFKVEITIVTINSAKLIVKSFGFKRQRENERKRERGKETDLNWKPKSKRRSVCLCVRESLTEQRNTHS
jgi:hypothetical protein